MFVWMISSTAEYFVTKLDMVMHHHELECHAKKFACYIQCEGDSEGLYDQNGDSLIT